ncbi:MAG: BrnT family toxin [Candidatus Sulfotelmatobacter sp.]
MIRFEWDVAKARINRRKHGIRFEIARHVFDDPDALVEQDRIEGGERRWQTIGTVDGVLLLLVAHNVEAGEDEADETIRIISARRANRKERKRYEEERQKNYS